MDRSMGWSLCLIAWSVVGAGAVRDAAAEDPSKAAKLFDQGLEDMRAGRHETGCPALAESYRLEPLPGVLFTVAECEASWGRLATALNHYDEFLKLLVTLPAEQAAKHKERRQVALEKVSGLSRLVPHLVIVVPSNPPDGLVIKRNGNVVDSSSWGVSVSLDPGDYELVAELPDGPVWTRTITLKQGERARADVELPVAQEVEDKPTEDVVGSNPYRTWAWVTAGLGAASLGVGVASGIVVLGKKGTIDDECLDKLCTQEGKDAADSAQKWGMVSTIGVGAGIALGAASVWLFMKDPDEPAERSPQSAALLPWVVPSEQGASFGVEGRF